MPARRPLELRFWEKVRKTETCWLWTGALNGGYGWIGTGIGTSSGLAHRISWELANGRPPIGVNVCHRCDNPLCVRPDHLFLGDQYANMADRQAKRRGAHGDTASSVKLTAAQVREIRTLAARGDLSQREIGVRFGVRQNTVSRILSGKRRFLVD